MANIVIAPLYWQANMNVTFALARKLRDRGHRICYACIPDTEARIRSQGFDFVAIFSGVFPPGTLAAQSTDEAAGKYRFFNDEQHILRSPHLNLAQFAFSWTARMALGVKQEAFRKKFTLACIFFLTLGNDVLYSMTPRSFLGAKCIEEVL